MSGMSGPADRELDALERELLDQDLTDSERRDIHREMREIECEYGERQQWQDEGHDRGWL